MLIRNWQKCTRKRCRALLLNYASLRWTKFLLGIVPARPFGVQHQTRVILCREDRRPYKWHTGCALVLALPFHAFFTAVLRSFRALTCAAVVRRSAKYWRITVARDSRNQARTKSVKLREAFGISFTKLALAQRYQLSNSKWINNPIASQNARLTTPLILRINNV